MCLLALNSLILFGLWKRTLRGSVNYHRYIRLLLTTTLFGFLCCAFVIVLELITHLR